MARQNNRNSRSVKERGRLPAFLTGGATGALVTLAAVYLFAPPAAPVPAGSATPADAVEDPFPFEFLDRLRQGVPPRVAPPRIEVETAPSPPAGAGDAESASTEYLLQAGSFPREKDADEMRALVILVGGFEAYDGVSLSTTPVTLPGQGVWYRVLVGPFPDKASVQDAVDRLRSQNIPALVLERPRASNPPT